MSDLKLKALKDKFEFFKDFIYLFLERGEGKEKERETSMCGCLSNAPYWPTTQAYALTGN